MEKNISVSPLSGKRFGVVALGCRTNLYEAEAIASALEAEGARHCEAIEGLDVVVIVTCTITGTADAKTRKWIRRLRRKNPNAAVVACGCHAQTRAPEEARALGVDILVGNRRKEKISALLAGWFEEKIFLSDVSPDLSGDGTWDSLSLDRPRLRTRAFVKVQDGCSRRCSYCVVPRARGMQVSREPRETVREISRIAASGCREVVLTGTHLGGYRHGDISLGDLIREISRVPGLRRLRMGSIEPFAVDDALLEAMSESGVFCPHLHIPLQSGDDGVLSAMRRGYTASAFARTVDRVRRYLGGDAHVSTDLIVGFPGETEEAFERSLRLLSSLELGKVHVFPFSPRAGTEAAAMADAVPPGTARERMRRATALSDALLEKYAAGFAGARCEILVEEQGDGIASGWTKHYVKACACSAD
jgi:threonylcarbamoyladenosine tRNA methylthiotransferase MtaB